MRIVQLKPVLSQRNCSWMKKKGDGSTVKFLVLYFLLLTLAGKLTEGQCSA